MSLTKFLESLFADGRVLVAAVPVRSESASVFSPLELIDAADFLTRFERDYRQDLPGSPPELSRDAMLWAAETLYRACSLLSHRDADENAVRSLMSKQCPADSQSPAVHYSVDLTLRFLPDLIRLARAASSNDPLNEELMRLAREWPLSSVGIADIGTVDANVLLNDPCLRRLYVDRILSADDDSRLDNPLVDETLRAAIGHHRKLAGKKIGQRLASG